MEEEGLATRLRNTPSNDTENSLIGGTARTAPLGNEK